MQAEPASKRATALRRQANAAGLEFVITELQTVLLFLQIADTSQDRLRCARAIKTACRAYDVAVYSLEGLEPDGSRHQIIEDLFRQVRQALAAHRVL